MFDEQLIDPEQRDPVEYEEITSDEVDHVIEALGMLAEHVTSENIRAYIEEASNNIYYLIYDEEAETEESMDDEELFESDSEEDELSLEDDLPAEAA